MKRIKKQAKAKEPVNVQLCPEHGVWWYKQCEACRKVREAPVPFTPQLSLAERLEAIERRLQALEDRAVEEGYGKRIDLFDSSG